MQLNQLTSCKSMLRCLVVLGLAWSWRAAAAEGEYFSSIDSMQYLGAMEKELIQMYRQYLETQQQDFAMYRKFIKHAKAEHVLAAKFGENYLGNPLNAFTLIKRAVVDWVDMHRLIANNHRKQHLNASMLELHEELPMPEYSDVRGAAKGLARLQKVYNLNASDLADGEINGFYYQSKMPLRDCFEIGANLFEQKEFRLAIDWLEVALQMLDKKSGEAVEEGQDYEELVNENDKEGNCEIADETDEADYSVDNESCDGMTGEEEFVGTEVGVMSDAVEVPNQENAVPTVFQQLVEGYVDTNPNEGAIEITEFQQLFEGVEYVDIGPSGPIDNADFQQLFAGADDMDNAAGDGEPESDQIEGRPMGKDAEKKPEELHKEYDDYEDKEGALAKKKILIQSLEYLAFANYELGFTDKALAFLDEIWEVDPKYQVKNLPELMLAKTVTPKVYFDTLDSLEQHAWFANYTRLCQGIHAPDPSRHQLKCRLDTKNKPVFLLAPLKVEELNLDPLITVYHQVLSDTHIENILTKAYEYMARSQVKNGTGSVVRDVRVSQQSWLNYADGPGTQSVYRLVTDITGMDLANAESMQVANYGIGGQYDAHPDYFGEAYIAPEWIGDRIMTNLFYLSDVEQGGHTVFTHLNVYSAPAKGSMVSWCNLHKSLTPDARTLHAGCPVIMGTKRIGNVWIHSGYQEFRRPCDLKDDSYKSIGFSA